MASGKAACSIARPRSAGLKTFWPSPPKTTLPRPIATTPPTKAIQSGTPGGSVRPRSSPVIAADPSRRVPEPTARSVRTQATVVVASTRSALGPNQ